MTSVDAFVHAEGLEHIDVLKIDTEVGALWLLSMCWKKHIQSMVCEATSPPHNRAMTQP